MDDFSLQGKTILITGASSGIGHEAAKRLSRHGAALFITGRDETRLQETFSQLDGTGHRMMVADLTDENALNELVKALPELHGIVHCAGIVGPLPVKHINRDDIHRMFGINFMVPVDLTGKIIRKKKLLDRASILFMSTIATRNPYFGGALYSASKAALEAYSKTLALEMVNRQIRSNCLMAGLVDTPMIVSPSEDNMQAEAMERYLKRYPLGIGEPADVAGAILFFMSDASKWISGTTLIMGGE